MRLKREKGKSWPRSTIYGRRLEVNVRCFGRLMITEAIAAASKSSKSTSTPADFGSSRFGEPDRVCEVFVAITASSFRCADVSGRILELPELCHTGRCRSAHRKRSPFSSVTLRTDRPDRVGIDKRQGRVLVCDHGFPRGGDCGSVRRTPVFARRGSRERCGGGK